MKLIDTICLTKYHMHYKNSQYDTRLKTIYELLGNIKNTVESQYQKDPHSNEVLVMFSSYIVTNHRKIHLISRQLEEEIEK